MQRAEGRAASPKGASVRATATKASFKCTNHHEQTQEKNTTPPLPIMNALLLIWSFGTLNLEKVKQPVIAQGVRRVGFLDEPFYLSGQHGVDSEAIVAARARENYSFVVG